MRIVAPVLPLHTARAHALRCSVTRLFAAGTGMLLHVGLTVLVEVLFGTGARVQCCLAAIAAQMCHVQHDANLQEGHTIW